VKQGEDQVTDEPPTRSRFLVRKGAHPGEWMVWDRQTRSPAIFGRRHAVGLSEEQAKRLLEQLTGADGSGSYQG
jgi:hypothetical protein